MNESDNEPEFYRQWLAEKREEKAPDGFAERVAEKLDARSESPRVIHVPGWARAAILIAAAIGGVGRYVLLGILILFR